MQIELTRDEMIFAAHGGVIRQVDAILRGRKDQFIPKDYWSTHVLGAMAECAVAKWRNRYWTPCYDEPTGVADLNAVSQVRSSPNPSSPLIVRRRDKAKHAFILVVTRPPVFELMGWLWGHEAKQEEFWQGNLDPPAWFVPQERLRKIA